MDKIKKVKNFVEFNEFCRKPRTKQELIDNFQKSFDDENNFRWCVANQQIEGIETLDSLFTNKNIHRTLRDLVLNGNMEGYLYIFEKYKDKATPEELSNSMYYLLIKGEHKTFFQLFDDPENIKYISKEYLIDWREPEKLFFQLTGKDSVDFQNCVNFSEKINTYFEKQKLKDVVEKKEKNSEINNNVKKKVNKKL